MERIKEDLKRYDYPVGLKESMDSLFESIDNIDTENCIEIIGKIRG